MQDAGAIPDAFPGSRDRCLHTEHTGEQVRSFAAAARSGASEPTLCAYSESSESMKTTKLFPATLLAVALACGPALALGQSSDKDAARQDAHQAGQDTKDAARDTGHAVKHGTKHAYHKTKHGAKKAEHKTKGAVRGAKNGAEDSH